MAETTVKELISWELLPPDFELPDEPVENLEHPNLAFDLKELLRVAGLVTQSTIVASNFGICAKVGNKTIVKAPDWVYIPFVKPSPNGMFRRSYTPYIEGDLPLVVMEFLSDTDNGEYDAELNGKWWFYEKILQVPIYVIFDQPSGRLEVYQLKSRGYSPQIPDDNGRYWIPGLNLFLGVWSGTRYERTGDFLRWWDSEGNMLLFSTDETKKEQLRADVAEQRADAAEQQAQNAEQRALNAQQQAQNAEQQLEQERLQTERMKARLRELGIDPEELG